MLIYNLYVVKNRGGHLWLYNTISLFKMLIDRKMSNNQLAKQAGISLNIITRLKRDEYIAMQTIEKICIALDCGVDDILEFISESQK